MGKLLSQREQMNLPFGMNEQELIFYSPTLYEMYRNEGQGYDKEAFRWDPIVSKGMLASEFAVADGLWWTMLLTPESQMQINPGDNLVVPVETYDDYRQLPPVEKYLTSDVSYTGKVINERSNFHDSSNSFCGDFNGYFNQESNAIGKVSASEVSPISTPRSISPVSTPRSASPIIKPSAGTTVPGKSAPITGGGGTRTGEDNPPICDMSFGEWGPCENGIQSREVILSPDGCIQIGRPIAAQPCGTGTSDADMGDGGGSMGGGGGFGGGGGGGASPEESTGAKEGEQATVVCKTNYKPVIIGIVAGLAVGYLYAKNKNKDIKLFSAVVAIIGGILGFVYAKHQCSPIGLLTKLKIPSKSNASAPATAKTEAKYYGGR